jgi:glycosyltransferase involved in cell wall biosynthesis
LRFRFVTATPQNVTAGSGTYVGIHVLAQALRDLGHIVDLETPTRQWPVFTAGRLWFNIIGLRPSPDHDVTIGFDCDGYRIAGRPGHIASLKGVIGDEVRFERGFTAFSMGIQARREKLHVHRAARVLVTSRYCADQVRALYGLDRPTVIVPELIDLAAWRAHLAAAAPYRSSARRTILFVGRFYRRKRVDVLLRAAAQLRTQIELRIVGNGPCNAMWRDLAESLNLDGTVTWLGDVSRAQLAVEYNRCDVFCLPAVQEGFGIVLLEAMAAGKPIVAARAAAIPEVARYAALVEPDNADALANALSAPLPAPAPAEWVAQFDAPRVARLFLEAVSAAIAKSG